MKILKKILILKMVLFLGSLMFVLSCNSDANDEVEELNNTVNTIELREEDKVALLFMLEEEKLARDTYIYLNDLWSLNQFENIKKSEQKHMDAVANLLTQKKVPFNILPSGEFENQELQNLYNQLAGDGAISKEKALQIGATIEDLDIKDLQTFIDATTNLEIIAVFKSLQCGSRNHLRSFMNAIEKMGDNYIPQFITQEAFNSILNSDNEQCN